MAKERNGTSENEPLASSTDEAEVRPRRSRGRRERGVRIQEASRIREPGITDPNEVEQFKRSSDNKNSKMTLLGVTSAFNLVQKVSDRIAIQKKQGKLNVFFNFQKLEVYLQTCFQNRPNLFYGTQLQKGMSIFKS